MAIAHLVERHLAKVEVASSSLVGRSKEMKPRPLGFISNQAYQPRDDDGAIAKR